jgi:cephalosporin-C deacetylase
MHYRAGQYQWRIGLALALALHALAAKSLAVEPPFRLKVTTDRPEAIYGRGEKVEFALLLEENGKPVVGRAISFRVSKDGVGNRSAGTVISGKEPVHVDAILGEPGFLRCDAWTELEDRTKITGSAGAAVEPLDIRPSAVVPDDFDYFWEKKKEQFAAARFAPVLTKVKSPDATLDCFDLQVVLPTARGLSAYYVKPKNAEAGTLPAILYMHGAGVRGSKLEQAVEGAQMGAIAVDFNAHGVPNEQSQQYYDDLRDGELKAIYHRGLDEPENIYFLELFRRMMAAMRFLTSQPEWDGKTLIVYGSSQGGGMALAAAMLEPRVSLCCASVPGMCDHTGLSVGRVSGWPKLIPRDPDGGPNPKAMELARYYDGCNFATRIHAQVVMSVGFIDRTCPPTTVYAAYNALPAGKKKMIPVPTMDHEFPPAIVKEFNETVRRHILLKKAAAKD